MYEKQPDNNQKNNQKILVIIKHTNTESQTQTIKWKITKQQNLTRMKTEAKNIAFC